MKFTQSLPAAYSLQSASEDYRRKKCQCAHSKTFSKLEKNDDEFDFEYRLSLARKKLAFLAKL
jgi:hypothetical protein